MPYGSFIEQKIWIEAETEKFPKLKSRGEDASTSDAFFAEKQTRFISANF